MLWIADKVPELSIFVGRYNGISLLYRWYPNFKLNALMWTLFQMSNAMGSRRLCETVAFLGNQASLKIVIMIIIIMIIKIIVIIITSFTISRKGSYVIYATMHASCFQKWKHCEYNISNKICSSLFDLLCFIKKNDTSLMHGIHLLIFARVG